MYVIQIEEPLEIHNQSVHQSQTMTFYLAKARKNPPKFDDDEFNGFNWFNLEAAKELWVNFYVKEKFDAMLNWAEKTIKAPKDKRVGCLFIFNENNEGKYEYLLVQLKKDVWSPPMGKLIFVINVFQMRI